MSQKRSVDIPSCAECKGKKDNDLFCHLPEGDLETLSCEKKNNFYKKNQVVFYEGNWGQGIYCIFKGKVKIHKMGEQAREQIVRFAKEGEIMGYRSMLGDEPYNATATVIEDSTICYIPKDKFMEVLDNNSRLTHKTIQLLAHNLRKSEEKIINITQKTVVERISEALLIMKNKFGFKPDGRTIDVVLTRREIGDLAGVTTETAIRTLSDLKKRGILVLKGKQIELVKMNQLVGLANLAN